LGYTRGATSIKIDQEINDVYADDFGSSPVFGVYNGHQVEVKVPLAQLAQDVLETIMPMATLDTGKLEFGKTVGATTVSKSAKLVLTPVNTSFGLEAITIHNAFPVEVGEINFSNDDQTVIEVMFKGYVDDDSTTGLLGFIGSPA
jgi:hypothetical protein